MTIPAPVALPITTTLSSTTVQGAGPLTLQNAVNSMTGVALNAPTTVASGATLSLTNSTIAGALVNDGTVTMSGNQTTTLAINTSSVLNRGEWIMSAASGQSCSLSTPSSNSTPRPFTNEGTLRATGAGVKSLNSTGFASLALTSTGSVLAEAGELRLNCSVPNLASNRLAGGVWDASADLRLPQAIRTIAADVTLRGSGEIRSIDGNTLQLATLSRIEPGASGRFIDTGTRAITPFGGTLLNEGTLALDGSGSLNIGGAFACSPSSVITRLASAANTAINATTGTIDGSFALSFDPSFAPPIGSTWTLASFPSGRSGAFVSTKLPPNTTLDLGKTAITVTIEKEVPVADLVSDGPVVAKAVSAGAPIGATFIERNAGTVDAVAPWTSRVDLVVSTTDPTVTGTVGTSVAAADLAPKGSVERTVSGTAPFFAGTLVPRLTLDANGEIAETSTQKDGESNNIVFGSPIEILAANLVATGVSAPTSIVTTEPATVSFATANTGAGDAIGPAFVDQVYLSIDATLDAADTLLGTVSRSADTLAAGASLPGSVTFTLPVSTASGTYSILVAVDATAARFESNDADNVVVAGTVSVTSTFANLVVTSVSVPSEATIGGTMQVSWTVQNTGDRATTVASTDRLFFSSDDLVGGDTVIGDFSDATTLAPGASYTRTRTVNSPASTGPVFVFVQTDALNAIAESTNEGDNLSAAAGPIAVGAPDLVVTAINAPATLNAGAPVTIGWTTANQGDRATVTAWTDGARLADSAAGGTELGALGNAASTGALAPNASANRSASGTVPNFVGNAFVRVTADIANSVNEAAGETNNLLAVPVAVVAGDLVASGASLPSSIEQLVPASISWSTTNAGVGASFGGCWTSRAYLSTDTALDAGDILLGSTSTCTSPFAAGANAPHSVSFTLPDTVGAGVYSVIIETDATATRFESNETNNVSVVGAVEVTGATTPNLVVGAVSAPSELFIGNTFELSWTISNSGADALPASSQWRDRIVRSVNTVFGDADDVTVAILSSNGPLAAGASRPITRTLAVPQVEGTFVYFVRTDDSNQIAEYEGEDDNVSAPSGPVVVSWPDRPDLVIGAIDAPSQSTAGDAVTVTVVERNEGPVAATGLRRIGIALSTNAVAGDADDVQLGDITVTGTLAPDAEAPASGSFVVPAATSGTRFVVASADRLNEVNELPNESNNRAVSAAIEVLPPPRADLGVVAISALEGAIGTQPASFSWTIANSGEASATGSWRDQVWLSQDNTIGPGDIMLVERIRSQALAAGAEYSDSATVALPDYSGPAHLVVRTDALDQVDEGADAAANTVASATFTVAAPSRPDLVAAVVAAPSSAQAGDSVSVTWRGTNIGNAPTAGNWSDRIYLSSDAVFSGDDVLLRTQPIASGALAPEASYQRTASVQIPISYTASTKFLIAVTDALGGLVEGSESNNAASSAPFAVSATPAPDLVAFDIASPTEGTFGSAVTVTWRVRNEGDLAAPGGFSDLVFLSTDATLSSDDIPVAVVGAGSSPLAPGADAPRTASVQLPLANALVNGTYRLLVNADGNASIEESDEGNNLVASAPIALVRPALPDLVASFVSAPTEISFGQPFEVTLRFTNSGEADLTANSFYKIIASGETQSILLAELLLADDLAIGASIDIVRQIATPQIAGGAFTLQVCADARSEVVESAEANNCANSAPITPRRPDLVVTAISAPTSATAGDTVSISYTVRNIGNGGASGFRGDLVSLSADETIGGDRTIAAPTASQTIAAGAEVVRTVQCTIPNSVEGTQRIVVTVDSTNSIEESGEGASNSLLRSVPIEIEAAPRPNLVVVAASAPASAVEGQRLTASFTVENSGPGAAEGGWVDRIYATRTDGPGFVAVGAAPGPATVAAGSSYSRSVEFTAPSAGAWRITVVTDDASNLIEARSDGTSGEDDNTRVAQSALAVAGAVVTATVAAPELELPTPTTLVIESRNQSTGALTPNVAGTRVMLVDGFPTTAPFTTGADGRAVIEVAPLANNAGVYGHGARAGNAIPAVQTQVIYWGVSIQADASERRIAQGGAASGQLLVRNLGELPIADAELVVEAIGEGVSATASLGASTLGANESRFIDYAVSVAEGSAGGALRFTLVTPKTTAKIAEFPVLAIEALPQLVATPGSISRDMLVGDIDYVNVTIRNEGPVATGPLSVQIASSPFATLATPAALPPLAPGASTVVSLQLNPSEDLVLGPYTANPWIAVTDLANDGLGVGVPITFNATSDATGTVRVRTTNEFSFYGVPPTYPNATVELIPAGATQAIASGLVDSEGFIEFKGVPAGNYTLRGTAPQHGGAQQSVVVGPSGLDLELFMSRVLVTYSWTVVPIPFSDQYTITITLNFETNVPAPVVTVEPVVLDLDSLDGEVSYREFTITNHGLIAADNTMWEIENTDRYEIIPLAPIVGDLLPGQSVVAPFLVIDNQFGQGLFNDDSCTQRPAMRATWQLLCGNTLGKYSFLLGVDKTVTCPQGSGPSFGGSCFGCAGGFNVPSFGSVPGASQPTPPGVYRAPNCEACFDSCGKAPFKFLDCMKPKIPFLPGGVPQPLVCGGTAAQGFTNPTLEALANMTRCMGEATLGKAGEGLFGSHKSSAPRTFVGAIIGASAGFGGSAGQGAGFGAAAKNAGKEFAKGVAKEFPAGKLLGCLADAFKACNCLGNQANQNGILGEDFEFPEDPFLVPDSVESENQLLEEFANLTIMAFRIARPYAYEFGSFTWWEQMDADFQDLVTTASGEAVTVADCEAIRVAFVELLIDTLYDEDGDRIMVDGSAAALLFAAYDAAPHAFANDYTPNPLPRSELERLVGRWNRTIEYYALGILTADDVPAGLSTDFIDVEVMDAYAASARAAVEEVDQYGYPSLEEALGAAFVTWVDDLATSGQGLCTTLTIELEQTVTLERQAFQARLVLDNETESALESVRLDFEIVDEDGVSAGERFVVLGPTLDTLTAIDGTGTLAAGASGSATFTLIPGDSAAPNGPTNYRVKGTLSYSVGGQTLAFPLFPAQITVLPNPSLELNYFIETQVFGDDPFTPELEPSVPFSLGLWAKNAGGGTAGNVRIESGEPQIVESDRDLLVDFDLIGTQVGTEERSPSLAVDLGDIGAGEVRVAQWLMTSTIQGEFVGYDVEISSLNGFNTPEFAVIDSATIEPLVRAVRADVPLDDGIPDFLVNQANDVNGLPDRIYLSEGAVEPVTPQILTASVVDPLTLSVDAGVGPGWRYMRIADPSGGAKRIARVVRDDARELTLGVNAWQTKFIDRSVPQPVLRADIHLFDRGGSGLYTIEFDPDSESPSVVQWASVKGEGDALAALPLAAGTPVSEPRSGGLSKLVATFSEPIDPASFDAVSISLAAFDNTGAEVKFPATTVSAVLTLGGTGAEIGFTPALPSGLRYCVRIVGATDAAGNLLAANSARLDVAVATGDVTGDQRTSVTDFGAIATLLGVEVDRANPTHVRCDLDGSGTVTQADLSLAMSANGIDLRAAVNPCTTFLQGTTFAGGAMPSPDDDGSRVASAPSLADMLRSGLLGVGPAGAGNTSARGDGAPADSDAAPVVDGDRIQLGAVVESLPRGAVLPGVVALRATPERLALGDALSPADAVEAFAFTPVGSVDGWFIAVAPAEHHTPASLAAVSAMLVASGLDVGVVVHMGGGWVEIVGPDLSVRFRGTIPASWQRRVLESFGGFLVTAVADDEWILEGESRYGGDAWKVLRALESRRDIEEAGNARLIGAEAGGAASIGAEP